MDELTIDGKIYISSKKAAEITGYAKDYVGQLCREGHVQARMVGRSWYVLESSIRAHRFGGDPHAEPVKDPEQQPEVSPTPISTWEQSKYVPEMVPSMPIPVAEHAVEANRGELGDPTAETLTNMEAAWKEWFANKEDTMLETPEIIDAREEEQERLEDIDRKIEEFKAAHTEVVAEEHSEPVVIQPIPQPVYTPESIQYGEIEAESEPVIIHHASEVRRIETEMPLLNKRERREAQVQARKERALRRKGGSSSIIIRASFVAVIVLVFVITAIGTGYAEQFSNNQVLSPLFDFLGGTSTYTR